MDVVVKPVCYDSVPACLCKECQLYDVKMARPKFVSRLPRPVKPFRPPCSVAVSTSASSVVDTKSVLPRPVQTSSCPVPRPVAVSTSAKPAVVSSPVSSSPVLWSLSSRPSCTVAESTPGLPFVSPPVRKWPRLDVASVPQPVQPRFPVRYTRPLLSRPRLGFADPSSPVFSPSLVSALPSRPISSPVVSRPFVQSVPVPRPGAVSPVSPAPLRRFALPSVLRPPFCLVLAMLPVLLPTPFGFVLSFLPVLR